VAVRQACQTATIWTDVFMISWLYYFVFVSDTSFSGEHLTRSSSPERPSSIN